MPTERNRFPLRLDPETQKLVKDLYLRDDCRSQNEFIEKAILFYAGFISTNDSEQFLSKTMVSVIRGTLNNTENRIARLLFKLAVEISMMMNVLASGLEITDDDLRKLRGKCVADVKKTSGSITFENAVRFQNGINI